MRIAPLLLALLLLAACSAPSPDAEAESEQATSTAETMVEPVTKAQKKAHEMAAEEGERVEEVDAAMNE